MSIDLVLIALKYSPDAKFIKVLKSNGIKVSMDGVGRALDNIYIERYWKSFKYESVYLHNYFNVFDFLIALIILSKLYSCPL